MPTAWMEKTGAFAKNGFPAANKCFKKAGGIKSAWQILIGYLDGVTACGPGSLRSSACLGAPSQAFDG
jgi:hypothetical protein